MNPELLILDCDGVLVDSEPLSARVEFELFTELGFTLQPQDADRFVGMSLKDAMGLLEGEQGRKFPPNTPQLMEERLEKLFRKELQPTAGIISFLQGYSGRRCVASSSSLKRLAFTLQITGLYSMLAPHIFSSQQVARGKPAPDLFLWAAQQMGVAPYHCLVVEDSLLGVQAAVAAGMPVVGFVGGGHCGPAHRQALRQAGASNVYDHWDQVASYWKQHG